MLGAVVLCAFTLVLRREIRSARGAMAQERVMRALASRPGWELEDRRRPTGGEVMLHFPWLAADRGTVVKGAVGAYPVTVVKLSKIDTRRGEHWLAVFYDLPDSHPSLSLQRAWSVAHLRLHVPPDRYLPMSGDVEALSGRLTGTPLLERLTELGAPAVSLHERQACFLYYPLPRITDLEELVTALADLLPTLTDLAGSSPSDGVPSS
ncbi:hypothetical protein AB0K80_31855 [Streptomyces sp. NPDC052682]|uniref:hypothetical protein n=1 Tax=Streptomyces sp. NPDC052682 TaxID=3154954 RepID=UPI003429512B